VNSREDKSAGIFLKRLLENPNSALTHDLKKNVGPMRYRNNNKTKARTGNKSMKNEKNRNSDTKKKRAREP
jgi:abortive infection bacteriophage resistance protein